VAALAAGCTLSACVSASDPRLKDAEGVPALEQRISTLEEQVSSLQTEVAALQLTQNPYESAVFDPSDPGGYARIDTSGGTFLVSLETATPYVDGFRLTFNVGNPSSATYRGFRVHAKWGARRDPSRKGWTAPAWRASLREKEISLTNSLHGGAWNKVSFVVAPAKAEEFGYLELSLSTDTISLSVK
jgi:hypothetical protein